MKKANCKHCNRPITGTARMQFCSVNCRSKHWQKAKRKERGMLRRFKLPKKETMGVEEAQYKVLAGLLVLEESALEKDKLALKVLPEVDKLMNRIAQATKHLYEKEL